ncbi:hypothetical protein ACFS07_22055 [Undibacterium arcticum]
MIRGLVPANDGPGANWIVARYLGNYDAKDIVQFTVNFVVDVKCNHATDRS